MAFPEIIAHDTDVGDLDRIVQDHPKHRSFHPGDSAGLADKLLHAAQDADSATDAITAHVHSLRLVACADLSAQPQG